MTKWYSRPVLFVSDVEATLAFYTNQLGFTEAWRYAEGERVLVAQADRSECELIFSAQEPQKIGSGRVFIALDPDVLTSLQRELEAKGVAVREGRWGYRTMIVNDPEGNELFFPYEDERS